MLKRRSNGDEPPTLKRGNEIDELFGRANPNPGRVGCPSHEVLIALARRERPIGDTAYDHLSACSPCYVEVRSLQEAAKQQRRKRIVRTIAWVAAGGAAALLAGTAAWMLSS
jgi:hypothetical protein